MTKNDWEQAARALWTEAYAADPHRAEQNAIHVVGAAVWVWSNLTVKQLHALRRALLPIALEARG